MLKKNARKLIDTLSSVKGETRLILAALMTDTISRTDHIADPDVYLWRLCSNFDLLGNIELLEKKFEKSKNYSNPD
jgi:hypothetical protein